MIYVDRDQDENITGVFAIEQYEGQEKLPENDAEIVAFQNPPPPTSEEIYAEVMQNQAVLKAVVLSLNDGTFVPGANLSNTDLKTIIKSKM